jgi:hypothetical protein
MMDGIGLRPPLQCDLLPFVVGAHRLTDSIPPHSSSNTHTHTHVLTQVGQHVVDTFRKLEWDAGLLLALTGTEMQIRRGPAGALSSKNFLCAFGMDAPVLY